MFKVTTLDLMKLPIDKHGDIDYSKDFFEKQVNLTVSGQLEAELAALGLSKVYTFGPTFRAENSNTSRHLAEFWMIEPEVAFSDLNDNINLATQLLKFVCNYVLKNYIEDIQFLSERKHKEEQSLKKELRSKNTLLDSLNNIVNNSLIRFLIQLANQILRNSKPNKKNKFENFPSKIGGQIFRDMKSFS